LTIVSCCPELLLVSVAQPSALQTVYVCGSGTPGSARRCPGCAEERL